MTTAAVFATATAACKFVTAGRTFPEGSPVQARRNLNGGATIRVGSSRLAPVPLIWIKF